MFCLETHATRTQIQTRTQSSYGHRHLVGVFAPAAVQFSVATLVVVVVVCAVVAICANKEQCRTVFLVGGSRCITDFHFTPFRPSPALTYFLSFIPFVALCYSFLALLKPTFFSFILYHTPYFYTSCPFCRFRLSFSSHRCCALEPPASPAPSSPIIKLRLSRYYLEDHGQTCCPQCPREPLHIKSLI